MVKPMEGIPENLSELEDTHLEFLLKNLLSSKRIKQREIDHLDTEIIGIKEEIRKREEKGLAERKFRSAFIKD